ncbi:30S ribosomal protein S16 [Succinimonas sp.]|jgi:small subunit ribosomal protein S16|uniref:30S ribosomal protein S16 n=1 Tax=Succinimonas sp. TaxID=1936151 RepID=UPI002E890279|nr:30S ribosomal protein S16 [Succinimonas sp.]
MVIIRLKRGGAKKRPFYHVVVADSRRALSGKTLEDLGYFNPLVLKGSDSPEKRLVIDLEKVKAWQAKGAQLSDRVKKLVKDLEAESSAQA